METVLWSGSSGSIFLSLGWVVDTKDLKESWGLGLKPQLVESEEFRSKSAGENLCGGLATERHRTLIFSYFNISEKYFDQANVNSYFQQRTSN